MLLDVEKGLSQKSKKINRGDREDYLQRTQSFKYQCLYFANFGIF